MNILKRWEDDKPENKAENAVFAFLDELIGRNGFGDWWYSIDDKVKMEILDSLVESIGRIH